MSFFRLNTVAQWYGGNNANVKMWLRFRYFYSASIGATFHIIGVIHKCLIMLVKSIDSRLCLMCLLCYFNTMQMIHDIQHSL